MNLIKMMKLNMLAISLSAYACALPAAELPWAESEYAHYSNQEPLKDLLTALAGSQKTPVVISDKVDEVVSVYFRTNYAEKIFEDLVKTYNLAWFYDGETLYIYTKEEVQTGSVALKYISPEDFTRSMKRLGILDDHFYWVASDVDKMIYFKGPERFVSSVLEMSRVMDKEAVKKAKEEKANPKPKVEKEPEIKGKIFKWVDKKGVVNFGSKLPDYLKNSRTSEKVENKGYEIVE